MKKDHWLYKTLSAKSWTNWIFFWVIFSIGQTILMIHSHDIFGAPQLFSVPSLLRLWVAWIKFNIYIGLFSFLTARMLCHYLYAIVLFSELVDEKIGKLRIGK